jgi:hypothetical protein
VRAPREERPRREKAGSRTDRVAVSDERKPRRYFEDDEPVPAGEWNGPRPSFLDVGFG